MNSKPWQLGFKSDFENSEDDKRTIIASLKKKAINASSKFRHSLKKKRSWKKNGGQINSVSIEDVWDAGELQAVDAFRLALISGDLLPPRHDDCHMLLRWSLFLFLYKFCFCLKVLVRTALWDLLGSPLEYPLV